MAQILNSSTKNPFSGIAEHQLGKKWLDKARFANVAVHNSGKPKFLRWTK